MVRGLISERSYPWAVEPAALNGSSRHRRAGEGSGGELERCLRWRSSRMQSNYLGITAIIGRSSVALFYCRWSGRWTWTRRSVSW